MVAETAATAKAGFQPNMVQNKKLGNTLAE